METEVITTKEELLAQHADDGEYDWINSNPEKYAEFTPNQRMFLEVFSARGSITATCAAIGIERQSYYAWMHHNPDFRAAMKTARLQSIESMEDEVVRRGKEGVEEPVYFRDKIIGYKTRYSDSLLQFYLQGNDPRKYRQRTSHEHTGPGGGPMLTVSLLDQIVQE